MSDPRNLEPATFDGRSLQEMHQWVHSGPGANAMHSMSDQWTTEQKFMQDLATQVRDRMTQAKVVIESQSGDAMQNAVAPVVTWTEVTADNATTQSQRMQEQGEAFSKVQAAVPNPSEMQPVPSDNWFQSTWASITGSKTDTQVAQQHNEQLRQEAVTAFNAYQGTTQSSVSGTPVFTAPPASPVDTGVHSSGGGGGVGNFSPVGGGGGTGGGGGGAAGGGAGGLAGGGHTGAGGGSVLPGGAPLGGPPVGTHSASFTPTPTSGSFQSSSLGAGGAAGSGGGFGGVSGVIGGFGGGGAAGGGAGGSGGRLGGSSGLGGAADEEQSGRAGGRAGSLAAEEEAAAGRGGSSSSSASQGGAAGRGAGRKGEEDDEHYSPEFLKGDHGFFDDDMPAVAPPVFGE